VPAFFDILITIGTINKTLFTVRIITIGVQARKFKKQSIGISRYSSFNAICYRSDRVRITARSVGKQEENSLKISSGLCNIFTNNESG
jgi:hypothetical protein